ncbi:TonB-dependent receptor [Pseudoduganella ginsengisoli]|uniref:TonB-dependent receptor plug domain-containing protein n=1 Tax=Pseudoduganella ginsengisoli TaxID=1462440 RepID=A0A6L6PWQ7_9BURK|nr:TonB-dependent receptor [Pseudoduganella ginsengisoli]MTW01659.1 TonB-dependent receptor plug domain-containing protein [Pseudoduganella ginsengisoli]
MHQHTPHHGLRLTIMAAMTAACWSAASADEMAAIAALPMPIVVISATPLPGAVLQRQHMPSNAQTLDSALLDHAAFATMPDLLNRLGGVVINDIQGNPFQADVSYRGFTASPLLGTPQGLSIYMDGVRLNQPFGDVVSWDLIPRSAIAAATLVPGSNPLFGLNTLGGALALQTKDGREHGGTAVQSVVGSFGRKTVEFEHGGHNAQGWHWFAAGNGFKEQGWREDSPSRAGQLFGKLGWSDAATDAALTMALAGSRLHGNGLQEQRMLQNSYRSVYTKPDITRNRSALLNLTASRHLTDALLLSGNAYLRRIRTSAYNGDVNDDALSQSLYQPNAAERAALAAAGYAGYPAGGANAANTPFPYWRCIANVLRQDEPSEKCNGLINRTAAIQRQAGLGGQIAWQGNAAAMQHRIAAGAALDTSRADFRQSTQFGYVNPDHSIQPVDFYADGAEISDDGAPVDTRVDVTGRTRTWSLYATDTVSVTDRLAVTLSGRYNRTSVHNRDHITPGGASGSLDGDHHFSRFNPALGAAWQWSPHTALYGGYSEGSRTPTAVELGCADPATPCKLPNSMAGDPPLRQVVTRTWEAGLRGKAGYQLHWQAGVFRAANADDILFVADNAAGFGYFRNFGKTRRQGVELGIGGESGAVAYSASYTWLDATFRSAELVNGAANSSRDADGNIAIRPGNRLPLVPAHVFKAQADWQVTQEWKMGLGVQAVSGATARGNENSLHQPDGKYFIGAGRSAGYAVFDFSTRYQVTPRLSAFASISNLFDRRFATAAQLGATGFTASGNFIARPYAAQGDNTTVTSSTFYGPGAPPMIKVGLRYAFGK